MIDHPAGPFRGVSSEGPADTSSVLRLAGCPIVTPDLSTGPVGSGRAGLRPNMGQWAKTVTSCLARDHVTTSGVVEVAAVVGAGHSQR